MGTEFFHKRGECLRMNKRGVQCGNYSWVLIQTHIPEILLSLHIKIYFPFECMRAKSSNTCKRVGVRSQTP
jgi:hypothetical protein